MANKQDLIAKVAEATELTKKDSAVAVDAVFSAIESFLSEGEKVQLIGFGNFEVRERAARKGRNPQTGEEIEIAASKVPAFKAGKALKDAVNNYIERTLSYQLLLSLVRLFFLIKRKSFTVINQSNPCFYVIIEHRSIVNLRVINVKKELNHG